MSFCLEKYKLNTNSLDYSTISRIRYPMMLMVVLWHLNISNAHVIESSIGGGKIVYDFLVIFLSRNFARCVNAIFFFISGFLYFANVKQQYTIDVYKRKTITRIKSLVLPYIIWNTIVIGIYLVVALCNSEVISSYLNFNNYWETDWSQESMGTPIDGPLWFIRDLFIQALLAPLTYVMVKHFHIFYIVCLVVLFYFNIGITGMAPVAYLFFAFGALFGIHKISFVALFRDYSKWLLAAAIAALLYKCLCSISALEDITHGFLWDILGVAALLCAASFLYKPLFSSIFKESCFFLYAIHQQLIIYPLYYCFKTAGWEKNIWGVNGMFIITFIVSVAISILISYSFNRYCPKIHKILSGNR